MIKLVDSFRSHVIFAAASSAVTTMRKIDGKANEVPVAVEFMVTMLVTEMAVRMVVQTG